jgi:hypothetical protein
MGLISSIDKKVIDLRKAVEVTVTEAGARVLRRKRRKYLTLTAFG